MYPPSSGIFACPNPFTQQMVACLHANEAPHCILAQTHPHPHTQESAQPHVAAVLTELSRGDERYWNC